MSSTSRRLHYILDYLGLFHRGQIQMDTILALNIPPDQGVFAGRLQ